MLSAANFEVGDWFTCEYNGKPRTCEVLKIPHADYIVVQTADGPRSFKYSKICRFAEIVPIRPSAAPILVK